MNDERRRFSSSILNCSMTASTPPIQQVAAAVAELLCTWESRGLFGVGVMP
ncbi:hypothetical protein Pint_27643 [Pistacia integerrima]|uniref:Uncharacterized protein n=1 Tax=Pistacia integerrima TaxID=434235 RepID=A0ACC0YT04_9ROSI|nr:hypothetical protein Pint_27643 [Pistacia integerrima]